MQDDHPQELLEPQRLQSQRLQPQFPQVLVPATLPQPQPQPVLVPATFPQPQHLAMPMPPQNQGRLLQHIQKASQTKKLEFSFLDILCQETPNCDELRQLPHLCRVIAVIRLLRLRQDALNTRRRHLV